MEQTSVFESPDTGRGYGFIQAERLKQRSEPLLAIEHKSFRRRLGIELNAF